MGFYFGLFWSLAKAGGPDIHGLDFLYNFV